MMSLSDRWVMKGGNSLLNGVLQDRISGEVGWQQKSCPLGGDGKHALVWVYSKDSGSDSGSDRGWVDYLQWTSSAGGGSSTTDWEQITYTYDPSGRRIAKDVDGVVTKYRAACPELVERDGDQCIAEYDGSNNLLRKYIHGPCIDEPICMIEAAGGYAGTYFYHFDALGSVVALSDAAGDTVQVYEYDVYGQVAASDPNHPNRFMFTSREFDKETGLYYYRARYYNPTIGRFLQTDPIGYEDGVNLYTYCRNNPLNCIDPSGTDTDPCGSDPCDHDPCDHDPCDLDPSNPEMASLLAGCRNRKSRCEYPHLPGPTSYTGFKTPDAAAAAAGAQIAPKTANNHREYFYWIFEDPATGTYGYTSPVRGERKFCPQATIDHATALLPPGAAKVAWGHSHGPLGHRFDPENFSGAGGDEGFSNYHGLPAYLHTPSGQTGYYDPSTGNVKFW